MKVTRIFETVIYGNNLKEMKSFYEDILGLRLISESDRALAFRLPQSVLLVFDPEKARSLDRIVPKHGADGAGHTAFAVSPKDLDAWRSHLRSSGIQIETEVAWEEGGTSIYFRDPAGNSVELAPPTLWGGKWDF